MNILTSIWNWVLGKKREEGSTVLLPIDAQEEVIKFIKKTPPSEIKAGVKKVLPQIEKQCSTIVRPLEAKEDGVEVACAKTSPRRQRKEKKVRKSK